MIYIQAFGQARYSEKHSGVTLLSQSLPKNVSKSRNLGVGSSRSDRSIELRKKAPNTLKTLKRAQKCAPPGPAPGQACSWRTLATGKAMRIHVIPPSALAEAEIEPC